MDRIKNDKKLVIILFTMIFMIIGLSYAFYTLTINGNDTSKKNIVKSGNLEITFDSGAVIDAKSILPGDVVSKTFTVTNTGNREIASYSVYFSKLVNTFLYDEIVYSITCSSNIGSCNGQTQTPVGDDYSTIRANNSLAVGETQTYTLRIEWLEMSSNQNYNEEADLQFKILVNETYEVLTGVLKGTGGSESYTGEYYAYKASITSVILQNEINVPADALSTWDVSYDSTSKVMAYIKSDGVSGYKLYIQSDNIIYAPIDSSYLFASFVNMTSITGLEYLNTDLVTNMAYMFYGCNVLASINVTTFDTSRVTSMAAMFDDCYTLSALDLSSFITSSLTNSSYMFAYASDVDIINLHSASFTTVTTYNNMFSSIKNGMTITVKDEAAQTFINARLTDAGKTGTVTVG